MAANSAHQQQSSLNPLRELLNTILRELGERPYFTELNTAAVASIRGPRRNANVNAPGYVNNTNISSNYNVNIDTIVAKTNNYRRARSSSASGRGAAGAGASSHSSRRRSITEIAAATAEKPPHTPNYNFLKQHLLDLTNWCLARGSHYNRVDTVTVDSAENGGEMSLQQKLKQEKLACGAEEFAVTYWDPETIHGVLSTIAAVVRHCDDVGVYSPAASFASPNLKERLLMGKVVEPQNLNLGMTITSIRTTTQSLLSGGDDSTVGKDDTGLSYIAPLRLCTPSEVLHLLHMCAEAATCFTVVASSQLDMPKGMLKAYSIDPKSGISMVDENNKKTFFDEKTNPSTGHNVEKLPAGELNIVRNQMQRTVEMFCESFAKAVLSIDACNNSTINANYSSSVTSGSVEKQPKSIYFIWLLYKTISEALNTGNNAANVDAVIQSGGADNSPKKEHVDPLSASMRARSRGPAGAGGAAGPTPAQMQAAVAPGLQRFFESIREAIQNQQHVEGVLSPLRRKSMGPMSAAAAAVAAANFGSPNRASTAGGAGASVAGRNRANSYISRRYVSTRFESTVTYRHPQYFPLLAELLASLCIFWKKKAYGLVKTILSPVDCETDPLKISERNAKLQQAAELRSMNEKNKRSHGKQQRASSRGTSRRGGGGMTPRGGAPPQTPRGGAPKTPRGGSQQARSVPNGWGGDCSAGGGTRTAGVHRTRSRSRSRSRSSSTGSNRGRRSSISRTPRGNPLVCSRLQLYERLLTAEQRRQERLLATASDGALSTAPSPATSGDGMIIRPDGPPLRQSSGAGPMTILRRPSQPINLAGTIHDVTQSIAITRATAAGADLSGTIGTIKSTTIRNFFANRRSVATESMLAELEIESAATGGAGNTSALSTTLLSNSQQGYVPMSQRDPEELETPAAMAQRLAKISDLGRNVGDVYGALDSTALLSIKKEFVAMTEAARAQKEANQKLAKKAASFAGVPTARRVPGSPSVAGALSEASGSTATAYDIAEAKKRSLLPTQFAWVSGGTLNVTSPNSVGSIGSISTPAGAAASATAGGSATCGGTIAGVVTPAKKKGAKDSAVTPPQPTGEAPKFYSVKTHNSVLLKGDSGSPIVPSFIKAVTKVPANAQLGVHPPPASAADMLKIINKEDLPLGIVRLKASIVGHNASSIFLASLHAERFCYAQALHSMHSKLAFIESAEERRKIEREWLVPLSTEVEHAVNVCKFQHMDLLVEILEADLEDTVDEANLNALSALAAASGSDLLIPERASSLLIDANLKAASPCERLFVDLLRQRLQVDNLGFAAKRLHAHRHFTPVSFMLESTLRQLLSPIMLLRLQRAVFRFRRMGGGGAATGTSMNHPAYTADHAIFSTFGQPTNIVGFALMLRDDAFGTVSGGGGLGGASAAAKEKEKKKAGGSSSSADPALPTLPEEMRDVFLSLWEVVTHTFMKHNRIINYRAQQQSEERREQTHREATEALRRNASMRSFSGLQSRTSSFSQQKPAAAAAAATEAHHHTTGSVDDIPVFAPMSQANSARSTADTHRSAAQQEADTIRRTTNKLQEDADFFKIEASKRQRCLGTLLWLMVSLSHYMVGDAHGNAGAPLLGILQAAHRCFPLVVEVLDYALTVKQEVLVMLRKVEAAKAQLRLDAQSVSVAKAAASGMVNLAASTMGIPRSRQASAAFDSSMNGQHGYDSTGAFFPGSPHSPGLGSTFSGANSAQQRAAHNALLVPQLALYETLLLVQGIIHHGLEVSDVVIGTFSNRHLVSNNIYSHNFFYLHRKSGRSDAAADGKKASAKTASAAQQAGAAAAARAFADSNTDPVANAKDAATAARVAKLIRPSVENQIHSILSLVFLQHASNTVAAGIAAHTRSILLAFTPGAHHFQVSQQMAAAAAAAANAQPAGSDVPPSTEERRDSNSAPLNRGNSNSQRFNKDGASANNGSTPANSTDGRNGYPLSARPNGGANNGGQGTPFDANLASQESNQTQTVHNTQDLEDVIEAEAAAEAMRNNGLNDDDVDEMSELRKGLLDLKSRMQPYIDDQRRVDSDLNGSLRDLTGILGKYRQATSTAANGASGAVAGNTFYWPQGMPSAMLDSMNYVSEMAWLTAESGGVPPTDEYVSSMDASEVGGQSTTNTEYADSAHGGNNNNNGYLASEPTVLTDFGYISLYLLPLPLLYLHQVRLIRHYRCVHKYYSQRLRVWLLERQRKMEMKTKIRQARQANKSLRARRRNHEARQRRKAALAAAAEASALNAGQFGPSDSNIPLGAHRRQSIDTQPPNSAAASFRRPQNLDSTAAPNLGAVTSGTFNMTTMAMSMAATGPNRRHFPTGGAGSDADAEEDIDLNNMQDTYRALASSGHAAEQIPTIVTGTGMPTEEQLRRIVQDQSLARKRERRLAESGKKGSGNGVTFKDPSLLGGAAMMQSDGDDSSDLSSESDDDFEDALENPLFVFYDFAEHERLQESAQADRSARGTASNASSAGQAAVPSYYHNDHPLDFLLDPYLGCALVLLSASASYLDDDNGVRGEESDDEESFMNGPGALSTEFGASSPLIAGLGSKDAVNTSHVSDADSKDPWGGNANNNNGGPNADGVYPDGRRVPIALGKYGVPLTAAPSDADGYTIPEIKKRLKNNYVTINENFGNYLREGHVIEMSEMLFHQKHNYRSVVLLLSNEMLQLVEDSISMCQRPTAVAGTGAVDASGAPSYNNSNGLLMTTMINGVSNSVPSWMRMTGGGNPIALAAMQAHQNGADTMAQSASPDRSTMGNPMLAGGNLRGSFNFDSQEAANALLNGQSSPLGGSRNGHGDSGNPNAGGGPNLNDAPPAHDVNLMITNPQLEETSMLSHAYSPIMARPKWKVAYFRFLYVLFLQQYQSKAFLFTKKERAKGDSVVNAAGLQAESSGHALGGAGGSKSHNLPNYSDGVLGMTTKTNFSNYANVANDVSSSSDDEQTPDRQKMGHAANNAGAHTGNSNNGVPLDTVSPRSPNERSSIAGENLTDAAAFDVQHFTGLRALLDSDPMVKSNFIVERQVTNEIKTLRRRHNRSYYRCYDVLLPRQQMLVGKFTERMVTFLLSAIRLMVELDDENCFVLNPRKRSEEIMSARNRGRSQEGAGGSISTSGFSLERVSLREKAYKMGLVPTLTKEIDLENTMHEMQHRQMKRRNRASMVGSASMRQRGGSMSPAKMGSLFTPDSPQKNGSDYEAQASASQRDNDVDRVMAMMGLPSDNNNNNNVAKSTPPSATMIPAIPAMAGSPAGVPLIPSLRMPAPGSQSPRNAATTPTSARGGLPPLHPMSSRGTPRLTGIPPLSPRAKAIDVPAAAAAPAPTKPKLGFTMPKLALNLAPPPIYYTSSGDTAAAAEGELSVEQANAAAGMSAAAAPPVAHKRVPSVDFTTKPTEPAAAAAPAPAKPKLPFAMPKLALNLAPPPIYYTSSGDTAAAAEGQLSNESAAFTMQPSSTASASASSPNAAAPQAAAASPPAPTKPKLPFAMPKLALNLAPPPIYYTSSGDTAAAAEGQLSDDISTLQQQSFLLANNTAGSSSPNSYPPSQQASPPQATKPKLSLAMPKLKLSLAPPPIYYTSSGDTAAAAEGQLGEDLSLQQQKAEAGIFGSMSPIRGASVSSASPTAVNLAPALAAAASPPAPTKPKLAFSMPKLALNLAPPPIYYTSSGDTAAAAEGQLSNESAAFMMQPSAASSQQQQPPPARQTPPPVSIPPVQVSRLALGGFSNLNNDNAAANASTSKSEGTPRIAQRSPRVVSVIEEPVAATSSTGGFGSGAENSSASPRRFNIPLIPILRQTNAANKPSSQQDPGSTPHSVSARGDAPSARRPAGMPPMNMKRLQISPHTQVVSPADEENDGGNDTPDRSPRTNNPGSAMIDFMGSASPRNAPGMGDMAKEEKNTFQGFVSTGADDEFLLDNILGGGVDKKDGGAAARSVFYPSALVSDNERRFGPTASGQYPAGQYAPLEGLNRRSSVSLINPLISDEGPTFMSGGKGNMASPSHPTSPSAGGNVHGAILSIGRNANSSGQFQQQQSGSMVFSRSNRQLGAGGQQAPNGQMPRAASVIAGDYIAPRAIRPYGYGRTESFSGSSVGSPMATTLNHASCGSFVADRGTFPVQLLTDLAAFTKHHRRSSRPIYASLHVHAQVLYLLMTLLLRGLTGTSNPIIHPAANIKPSRKGPQHHSMGAASRNNATCGTLDERYSAAYSNLINNPANSAGVAISGLGGGQNVLHPLHKHINHPLNQAAVRHLQHLVQSENLNQGMNVLIRLLTACGQSEANNGLPAPVLGRFYMGLDSSNQGQTASNASGASFVGAPLLPVGHPAAAENGSTPVAAHLAAANKATNSPGGSGPSPQLLLAAPPLSDLHAHSGTSTIVNIPMGAKMIGKGGYGTVLASNVAVVYSTNNDTLPNPEACIADQAEHPMFQRFVGAYVFGDSVNVPSIVNSRPITHGAANDNKPPRHDMSFPITPSTTIVDPKLQITKTPSIVSLPVAVKLIGVPTFAEDRCALFSLHSEVLIMLRAQDGGRYRTGNALNAALVGNPSTSNCSELLDFGCSGNQYYVVMKRYPTSVKDWRERLVWDATHLVKGRKANLNIEVSEELVNRELAATAAAAAAAAREHRRHRSANADALDATAGTMTLNDLSPSDNTPGNKSRALSGNVSSAGDRTLSASDESSSEDSYDSDDSFAETKAEKKAREERRERERLAEKIKDAIFDAHKSVSDDVLWLAATKPLPAGSPTAGSNSASTNLSPTQVQAALEQSLISSKVKPHGAIPEVKNPVLATMFPVLAHLFIQMLDTIVALHQRSSTIHYDIKCDNFFLDFSDCGDRETEDLIKEALASAGGAGGLNADLARSLNMNPDELDPSVIAANERLQRLNGWAEEAVMMAGVAGADGTLPHGNMVKVRLGDFGESYVNSKFANRQAITAQTQRARLDRYRRLYEKQKQAISKIRQSVRLGKTELSDDDDDNPANRYEEDYISDDLSDHFIATTHGTLANAMTNAAARGEFVADDDRYESASDEGEGVVEDRRHSSDPDTDPEEADQFDSATKRANTMFTQQTPVPAFNVTNTGGSNPFGRRMSIQPPLQMPMSARSGSGNRSAYDAPMMSARLGNRNLGDSPTLHTPTNALGGLPPSMHLKLGSAKLSTGLAKGTPMSARFNPQSAAAGANPNTRRGGPMILQLALAQTSRVPAKEGNNGSIPNSARPGMGPLPSARYGNSMLPLTARNGGNKASATSKLDKRYARGTEIIRPPELLLPHKFLADRRRGTHRTGYESDIWAVGCLLYELLTGDFLFYENLFPKMLARVTNHEEALMEESHLEMLNHDADIINFLKFVLTRDPQRRPLLSEVRRRFVLLAQKKLSRQFKNVSAHLQSVNPTADPSHIAKLASGLGFSSKIPPVLTKDMMLPVECRRTVLSWTLEQVSGGSSNGGATATMSLNGSANNFNKAASPSPAAPPSGGAMNATRSGATAAGSNASPVSAAPGTAAPSIANSSARPSVVVDKSNNATDSSKNAVTTITVPNALRTFHTFVVHSMIVNEMLPLFKAWRGALCANHQGLTGICLPIADANGIASVSANNAAAADKKKGATAANAAADASGLVSEYDPLITDDTVESILENAQNYNLAATVSAQRVNGYKRDAMVGARLWEEIEREKLIATASAECAYGTAAMTTPLNNIISAASIPDALYGANPIVNVTNLISILANSYLVLGMETDDADAVVPDFPAGDDGAFNGGANSDDDDLMVDLNSEFDNGDVFGGNHSGDDNSEEESLANSVISELLDNARPRAGTDILSQQASPRFVFGSINPAGGLGAAVGLNNNGNNSVLLTSRTGAGGSVAAPKTKLTPELVNAIQQQKTPSSKVASMSVRTLQQHGITHVLSFGPLPGVAKHFHYLDMSPILSKYEAEVAAIRAAMTNGTLEAMMMQSTSGKSGTATAAGKSASSPAGNGSASASAGTQRVEFIGGGSSRDEYVSNRLKPLHNSFIAWMVHDAGRAFCDHAASICGRVLVVPMIVMPTAIPRWVPMPLHVVCAPSTDADPIDGPRKRHHANGGSAAATAVGGNVSPSTANISPAAFSSPRFPLNGNNNNNNGSGAFNNNASRLSISSLANAAATATPQASVDMTLVWLLLHLTQTHRLPVITAMAHISTLCPILFQNHPQHRYLLDGASDALVQRTVAGGGLTSPAQSPLRGARGGSTAFTLDPTAEDTSAFGSNPANSNKIVFVRASAPITIDPVQCVQAAVSILELYRMLSSSELLACGITAAPPSYQLMSGPSEISSAGCATPLFGPIGGNQTVRDRVNPLMAAAFQSMYTMFEKKAKGAIKNMMGNASPNLKASLPYNDSQAMWNLVIRFVAKHLLSDDGTASAPRPIRPRIDDPTISHDEKKRMIKAAQIYSPISLKLRLLWHRCLCAASLYPTVDVSPAHSFFKEGTTPVFASEHAVATQKIILFDRHPTAPYMSASSASSGGANSNGAAVDPLNDALNHSSSRMSLSPKSSTIGTARMTAAGNTVRTLGPKARHHQNLLKHARWLVNESLLPFAAKTRYVHGEVAVRTIFPTTSTAACALAPQTNLLRCSAAGSSGGAPYSTKLSASPNPDSIQWQAVPRKPTASNEKDKPYSPAFTILVASLEGFLQQECIANKRRLGIQPSTPASVLTPGTRGSTGNVPFGANATYNAPFGNSASVMSNAAGTAANNNSVSPLRADNFLSMDNSPSGTAVGRMTMCLNSMSVVNGGDMLETSDFPIITNMAMSLAEVVLAAINAMCAFPDGLSAQAAAAIPAAAGGTVHSCRHCGMPTHVRLPNDLPTQKELTKEERDLEAEEGAIVSSRTYTLCPQGLVLATASNCNAPDPLIQSWYVHQHMHPRPE